MVIVNVDKLSSVARKSVEKAGYSSKTGERKKKSTSRKGSSTRTYQAPPKILPDQPLEPTITPIDGKTELYTKSTSQTGREEVVTTPTRPVTSRTAPTKTYQELATDTLKMTGERQYLEGKQSVAPTYQSVGRETEQLLTKKRQADIKEMSIPKKVSFYTKQLSGAAAREVQKVTPSYRELSVGIQKGLLSVPTKRSKELISIYGSKREAAERIVDLSRQTKVGSIIEGVYELPRQKPIESTILISAGAPLLKATGIGIAGLKGTQGIAYITAPREQKDLYSDPFFQQVVGKAYKAEQKEIATKGLGRQFLYEASSLAGTSAFPETIIKEYKTIGASDEEIRLVLAAAEREKLATGAGQISALAASSTYVEGLGQKLVAQKGIPSTLGMGKLKTFGTVAKATFEPLTYAGFIEGASQEVSQQMATRQDFNIGSVVQKGAFGAATAGILGSTIAGASAVSAVEGSKLLTAAYLTDPSEAVGDVVQDIISSSSRQAGIIVTTPTPSFALSAPAPVLQTVPESTLSLSGVSPTISKTPVPISPMTPTTTMITTPVPTLTTTPTTTTTLTTTPTTTTTFTTTPTTTTTLTTTPTATPQPFIPGGGMISFGGSLFIDEIVKKKKKVRAPSGYASSLYAAFAGTGLGIRPIL